MRKQLLAATAIVALAGTAAAAETGVTTTQAQTGQEVIPGTDMALIANASLTSHLASHLIGETVYNGTTADAQAIGEISDLVVAETGEIEGVVIGVGGFLGVGEKNVAIDFEQLRWEQYQSGDQTDARLVLAVTPEQLEAAPAFDIAVLQTEPEDRLFATPSGDTAMTPDAQVGQPADNATGAQTATTLPENLTDVDIATISADQLIGTTVYSMQDENVGSVGDVLLADDGTIDAVVLDVGGFLGIGTKPVAIAFDDLTVRTDANGNLFVYSQFTREQLEGATAYDATVYPEQRDTMRLGTSM